MSFLLPFPFDKAGFFKLTGQHDNPLAQHHQVYGRLFQIPEQGICPFLPEIGLDSLYCLVVIVADALELVVEIGQADVVVHRRLVDFHDLDFVSEKHGLDKF